MEISGVMLCCISDRLKPEGTAPSMSKDKSKDFETTWYTSETRCLLTGSLIMNCGMGKGTVGVQVSREITVTDPGILFSLTHLRISMLFTNVSSRRCKQRNYSVQGRNESKIRDCQPETAHHEGIVR